MKIGIVIADNEEYNPLLTRALEMGGTTGLIRGRDCVKWNIGDKEIIATYCGIGKVNAATATAYLIADEKCEIILNAGLSGAMSGVHRGELIAGESYVECDFDVTPIGYPLGAKPGQDYIWQADDRLLAIAMTIPGMKQGKLGCGDFFLTDSAKKELYIDTFGVNAFDMETGAIASVCHYAGVPFFAFRKCSDNADDTAMDDYTDMNDGKNIILADILLEILKKI